MSALPPKADIRRMLFDVSFGPKADIWNWRGRHRELDGSMTVSTLWINPRFPQAAAR
jgi:hypothetical protein